MSSKFDLSDVDGEAMKSLSEVNKKAAEVAEAQAEEYRARCRELLSDAIEKSAIVVDLSRLQHVRNAVEQAADSGTGVGFVAIACDECSFEMVQLGEMLFSDPPQWKVGCAACGAIGYVESLAP